MLFKAHALDSVDLASRRGQQASRLYLLVYCGHIGIIIATLLTLLTLLFSFRFTFLFFWPNVLFRFTTFTSLSSAYLPIPASASLFCLRALLACLLVAPVIRFPKTINSSTDCTGTTSSVIVHCNSLRHHHQDNTP